MTTVIKPMAIINSLTSKILKAQIEINGKTRKPSDPNSRSDEYDEIEPKSGVTVIFSNSEKNKGEFKLILKADTMPYEDGGTGIKVFLGETRQIFKPVDDKKIYRLPHHVETYENLNNGEYTITIHYELVEGPQVMSDIHGNHEDPEIIHPDKP